MNKKLCFISIMFVSSLAFAQISSVRIDMEPVVASIKDMGNSKISAYSRGNTITAFGIVTDEAMRNKVVEALKIQPGVENVENLIVVNPKFGKDIPTDSELKHSIEAAINGLGLKFESLAVHQGVVSIKSDLSSFREVDQMLATILGVNGVKEIKPSTLVNGKPYLSDVTKNY